jgi:hypothetical protein
MASLFLFQKERGMPGPRLPMRKIRDVLRLSAAGMSKRKIAASLGVSATAARDCIGRARRAGIAWPLPDNLIDEALEVRLYPPPAVAAKNRRQPDWALVHRELRRPGVTLQLLWEEHRAVHPDGYGYSRYVAPRFMLRDEQRARDTALSSGAHGT